MEAGVVYGYCKFINHSRSDPHVMDCLWGFQGLVAGLWNVQGIVDTAPGVKF